MSAACERRRRRRAARYSRSPEAGAAGVLVDTHCHLADAAFAADLDDVLARALEAGVGHVVVIGESPAAFERARELAARHRGLSLATGIHPHDAATWTADSATWLAQALGHPAIVALGEIGLDYHYDHAPRPLQRQVFARQLALAAERRLPVVVHAREADEDVAAALRQAGGITAVLHSFSSGPSLLEAALARGDYVSFSGMATFRNWTLDDAVRAVPLDRLLLETDAPYLAPVPHRGRRNEPAWVRDTGARVAAVRGMTLEDLAAATTENAARVFGERVRPHPVSGER